MRSPRRILVATDFSAAADRALDTALDIAARSQAEVHLVHALALPSLYYAPYHILLPNGFDAEARKRAQEQLAEREERVRATGCTGGSHLGIVPAPWCIAERARELRADLVVIGSRGHTGLKRFALGSVAEATVKRSPVSVLTVRGEGDADLPKVIVVGVDFSPHSEEAVALAADWARNFSASLYLVHGFHPPLIGVTRYEVPIPDMWTQLARDDARRRLTALAAGLTDIDLKIEVLSDAPDVALDAVAERVHADLIVTGSRGLGGVKHALLGSVAERTLRHAPCSVLTVKGKLG